MRSNSRTWVVSGLVVAAVLAMAAVRWLKDRPEAAAPAATGSPSGAEWPGASEASAAPGPGVQGGSPEGGAQRPATEEAGLRDAAWEPVASGEGGAGGERPCVLDSDCQAGEGCVEGPDGARSCLRSTCTTDEQCGAQEACRIVNRVEYGPALRRCVQGGPRTRGQPCTPLAADVERSCALGLTCSHFQCGTPCLPDGGCEVGEVCLDEERGEGPACFRGCEPGGCDAGQTCLSLGRASRCVVQLGEDCLVAGCDAGASCTVHFRSGLEQSVATFQCRERCDPLRPRSCREGFVCGMGAGPESLCYRACEDDAACEEGESCRAVTEDQKVFGCAW